MLDANRVARELVRFSRYEPETAILHAPSSLLHAPERYKNSLDALYAATLPTGEIAPVDGTCMDFRTAKPIGQDIHDAALAPFRGYDTNLCLDGQGLRKIGQAEGDQTGIVMEVETTLEGVQLYTANFLSDRTGKGGAHYGPFGGFCLETQHYPDAINQPAFPSPVLRRGEQLHETTIYRFGVRK